MNMTWIRCFKQSEARIGAVELRELIAGVAAAPVGFDPDSWMLLVAEHPSGSAARKALGDAGGRAKASGTHARRSASLA